MDSFIGVYENAFSDDLCNRLIQTYDYAEASGFTQNRKEFDGVIQAKKKDNFCFSNSFQLQHSPIWEEFSIAFWAAYKQYSEKYAEALDHGCDEYTNYSVKLQKTLPSEGYHTWHFESSTRAEANRLVTWTVYLNNVEEGGETEFLYQSVRVKPKKGTLCLFPASYTHVHRGNPPLSGEKYIATGWLEF